MQRGIRQIMIDVSVFLLMNTGVILNDDAFDTYQCLVLEKKLRGVRLETLVNEG